MIPGTGPLPHFSPSQAGTFLTLFLAAAARHPGNSPKCVNKDFVRKAFLGLLWGQEASHLNLYQDPPRTREYPESLLRQTPTVKTSRSPGCTGTSREQEHPGAGKASPYLNLTFYPSHTRGSDPRL